MRSAKRAAQPQVGRPEVVPTRRDAMRFVDSHKLEVAALRVGAQRRKHLAATNESLRRTIQKVDSSAPWTTLSLARG